MTSQLIWARRLMLSAAITALVVALSSTITPAAQAAGPPTVEVAAGTPRVESSWGYGDASSPQTPIAASTRQITFEHPALAVTDVTCDLRIAGAIVTQRTVTASAWNGSVPIELAVPSRAVTNDPRKFVDAVCRSGDGSTDSFIVIWGLDNTAAAPTVVALFDDPVTRSRVNSDRYYTGASVIKVLPGAVLKINGPPGTWAVPYYPPWWTPEDGQPSQGSFSVPDGPLVDVYPVVTSDGSSISVTVPANVPAEFLDGPVRLSLGTFGEQGATFFEGELDLNADLPSKTTLAVSPTRILSVQRPTATVRLEALRTRIPVGPVTIRVDGRAVATATLTTADSGKVSIRLPAMRRGTHTVVASFGGSPGVAQSVSKTVRVQVIR